MRKANQEIKDPAILEEVLKGSEICRIAMIDDMEPYVLAFNYGYHNHALYIHCAKAGRKIDILRKNSRVCFEVTGKAELVKEKKACKWATTYRSVVGYGSVDILTDFEEKRKGLEIIMTH